MIRSLYVHNFRCLENFELPLSGQSSVLLIGNNGSGKTTVGLALEILQKIGRESKDLRAKLSPYETIGKHLAEDCREEKNTTWGHELLRHNASEIDRLRQHVRPILFQPACLTRPELCG